MDIVQLKQMEPIFGSWHVDREIGSGSFGKVYAIYKDDAGFRFKAALKVISIPSNNNDIQELDSQGFDHAAKVRYFDNISAGIMEEIRIMNTLRGYTNIVCFEDYQTIPHPDRIGRDILIRMELLERLDDYMLRIRATQFDVVTMLRDIAQALVLCDKKNIIHRDIKPDNIMVSESGDYKLVDFGIARNMERTSQASTKAGSYPYMAPEVQMHQPYGKAVDIYSLGVVAYRELNAYRYPFLPAFPQPFTAEERDMALYRRFKGEKIPPIPGVPKQLFAIIEKCIAHKPEHRYSNPQDLVRDLNDVLNNLPELRSKRLFDDSGTLLPPHSGKEFNPQGGSGTGSGDTPGSVRSVKVSKKEKGKQKTEGTGSGTAPSVRVQAEQPKKKKSAGKIIGIVAAVVLMLAAAGMVAYIMLGRNNNQPHTEIQIKMAGLPEYADQYTVGAQAPGNILLEGTASPNTEIVLNWQGKSQTTRADEEGRYSFSVEPDTLPQNDSTTFTVSYAKPSESDTPGGITIYRDGFCSLTIDQEASTADAITGTTDPWATVYREDGSGTSVQAGEDGRFILDNTSGQDGILLFLWAEDAYGNRSATQEYRIPYRPVALTIECSGKNSNQVITGKVDSIQLYGTGPQEETVHVQAVTDKNRLIFQEDITVLSNGEWSSAEIDLSGLKDEGQLYLTAEWAGGEGGQEPRSAENTVAYDRGCRLEVYLSDTEPLTEDTASLEGQTDPMATVKMFSSGGELLASISADNETGSFVMDGLHLTAGDIPYIVASDDYGNESERRLLSQVQQGMSASMETPVPEEVTRSAVTIAKVEGVDENGRPETGSKEDSRIVLTGQAQTGHPLEARIGNRTMMKDFQAEGDGDTGTYTVTVPLADFYSTTEQNLTIQVRYADGNGPDSETMTILYDAGAADPVVKGSLTDSSKAISGQADPGDKVVLGLGSDSGFMGEMQNTRAQSDGTFEIILEKPLEAGAQYLLYAQDAAGNMSNLIPVTVTMAVRKSPEVTVQQNGKTLHSGDRMNLEPVTVELTSGEEDCEVNLVVSGSVSGTEITMSLQPKVTLDQELGIFKDGETLHLTAHYADWERTRSSFEMDLLLDCSTMEPELLTQKLTSDMTAVEGRAEPGSKVYLVPDESEEPVTADADGNGVFRFNDLTLTAGERWELYAEDPVGNTSRSVYFDVLEIAGILPAQIPENLKKGYVNGQESQLAINGTAEPGKTIDVLLNDKPAAQGLTVSEEGTWSVTVGTFGMREEEQNTLQFFYSGTADPAWEISFVYDPSCGEIQLTENVNEDTEAIRGKTEPGASVMLIAQDETIDSVTSDDNGEFSIGLPAEYRREGQNLELQARDKAGNESEGYPLAVGVSDRTAIRIDREGMTEENGVYLVNGETTTLKLSGLGYGSLGLTLTAVDGVSGETILTEAISCNKGKWNITAALPDTWETIRIQAAYGDGLHEELSDALTLKYDGICELSSTVSTLVETMKTLDIRTESHADITAVLNGTQALDLELRENGEGEIYLPDLKAGDTLLVTARDRAGNTAEKTWTVEMEERRVPTVELDTSGPVVNGQAEKLRFKGTAMQERPLTLEVAGCLYKNILTDENGEWSRTVTIRELNLTDGEIRYGIGYSDRQTETTGSFTYDSIAHLTVGSSEVNEDTTEISGTAEAGSKIALYLNGKKVKELEAKNESFILTGFPVLNAGDILTVNAVDPAGNETASDPISVQPVEREAIRLSEPVPQDDRVKADRLRVSGRGETGKPVTVTIREDEVVLAKQTETPDLRGNWTISQTGVTMKDGRNYEITAEYEDGKSVSSGTAIRFTADGSCSLTGIAEEFRDSDTVISGRTDGNATVYLKINGKEMPSAQADGNGEFRFANLTLNYGDRLEIYAEDPLGNRSSTAARTVETAKEKLWVRMDQPKADMKVTRYLSTQGTVFSHEEVRVFYTLTSADGSYHKEYQITGEDLGEMKDSDLSDMVEKEQKDQPDLSDQYSIRYGYDISMRFDIQNTDIPNGDYEYALYVSGQDEPVYSATLHLADPEKEEKAEKPKDYVNSYAKDGVRFIAGLDELIMNPFPDNGMLLTGWIWAPEGMLGKNAEIVVYYPMNGRRYPTPLSAKDIQEYDGTDRIVYRNIAAENPDLVKEYGQPDTEKAGFVIWLPIGNKFHVLKPGTHEIEVCLRDTDDNEWKIGTYEITLQEGVSGLNGEARMYQIIGDWESRRPAE